MEWSPAEASPGGQRQSRTKRTETCPWQEERRVSTAVFQEAAPAQSSPGTQGAVRRGFPSERGHLDLPILPKDHPGESPTGLCTGRAKANVASRPVCLWIGPRLHWAHLGYQGLERVAEGGCLPCLCLARLLHNLRRPSSQPRPAALGVWGEGSQLGLCLC